MERYPQFYGGDPVVIGQGAVFILFAIGVANGLALVTYLGASRRLQAGDRAPAIIAKTIEGSSVYVPGAKHSLTHVQFLRFAGCPVCNLLLQSYIKRASD
jgi:hypothetical protein